MKVVILAGGFGTRFNEETDVRPKPMVDIGDRPILWHIMKTYSHYGFNEFVILLGYKGYVIKEYFNNYFLHQSDVTIDLSDNSVETHSNTAEPWKVTLLDTGVNTMTGGRILRAREHIGKEPFLLTYGDGVADVDIKSLVEFHRSHGKSITITAVHPEGRFGHLKAKENGQIEEFLEKPEGNTEWINGGYFVCEPTVFDYIDQGDSTVFERNPLEAMAKKGELFCFRHSGFWKCMDTLRDKLQLGKIWDEGTPPWKVWG